jgi:cephalosporin hydroxylase
MGHRVMQYPSDLLMKQEILNSVRPDLLTECGTAHGRDAFFYAHLFDLISRGRVITIDIEDYPDRPDHRRIE